MTSGQPLANVECMLRKMIDAGFQSTQEGYGIWQCANPQRSHRCCKGAKSQPRGREMAVRGCHICKLVAQRFCPAKISSW